MSTTPDTTLELKVAVLRASLGPALQLARAMALPVQDLLDVVELEYFRAMRGDGLSLRALAPRFGRSLRTLATLSRRAQRQDGAIARGSFALETMRLVLLALSRRGPRSASAIARSVRGRSAEEIDRALEALSALGLVERDGERFAARAAHFQRIDARPAHRVESLRHFLAPIGDVILRRFLRDERGGEAFARVLTFRASPEALTALREKHYAALRDDVVAIDASAAEDAGVASIAWCSVSEERTARAQVRTQ
ncbi:hypothetical protein [Sandaracinus amylolyticus]|nr:hypothetical protein [Sandaracinus amylolyticus]